MSYGHDNANHLKQVTQGSASVAFNYDGDGRRTSTTLANGVAMNYSFDTASQLSGITYTQGATQLGSLTYAYDLAGRRTGVGGSYARTSVPLAASASTYNANNQLANWQGTTLTYDLNGNLTNDGTNTYTWNARNQLVTISGSVSATFQYDAFGRRVSKTIGGTTQFLYDGVNPVQELIGTSAPANLLTGGVDEYFQRTDSAGARSFLTDALGSTIGLADSTGTVQTSYTFEPFGNTTVTGATTTNSFAFTGRELDTTGLFFHRARYYNPQIGRFMSEDPIGFAGGINLYGYAGQNPISLRDSFGLQSLGDRIAAARALIDAAAAKAVMAGRKLNNRLKNLARCADSTSQVGSINSVASAVTGTDVNIPLIGGNSVGELESVLVGPEPGTDPTTGTNERIQQGINVAADVGLHSAVLAAPHVVIGTFTSLSTPVSYASGVYNPIAVTETSATLSGTEVGGALENLSGLLELKLAYDAEIYVLSYGVCLYTHNW